MGSITMTMKLTALCLIFLSSTPPTLPLSVDHCGECSRLLILSSGPAAVEQKDSLGLYHVYGSFWENTIPFFQSSQKYLTVHPYSNPSFDYVPWIVSDYISSLDIAHANATIRTKDREGIICPWEEQGLVWEYKTKQGNWAVDSTLQVVCN